MQQPIYTVEAVGPKIDSFLAHILKLSGLDLNFTVAPAAPADDDFETPDLTVQFSGPDVDELLANRAELLLALEHVTLEMLRAPSEHHSRISFDANDYRLMRVEELRMSAAAAADRVKKSGQPFKFSPMTSRERRIIHLSLRNETELRSESLGSGPHRIVIVYPKGMPSLPESAAAPPPFRRDGGGGRGGDRDRDRGPRGGGGRDRERGPRGGGGRDRSRR